tara:strand:- start:1604 stop:2644 length:1041 start_codon:yes stop_codon:yes gene_type:complete
MKRILLIVTVYRIGERIFPIIPKLSEFAKIDVMLVYQMSKKETWYGDKDMRIKFKDDYGKYFDNVYDMDGDRLSVKGIDLSVYDLVIYDDNRDKHNINEVYKKIDCPVLANVHGNWWLNGKRNHNMDEHNKAFDYVSVFGNKEKNEYKNNSHILVGGIPSNDDLKYYDRTNDYILVIVNFLGNRFSPYSVNVNEEFIKKTKLLELQKKYNKKVVFKLKSRRDHPFPQKDYDYVKSIVPKELDYITIMDFEDNNQLICGAFLVISAPSTFAFKSIQKKIPTILIKDSGIIGNFDGFPGLINLNDDILKNIEYQIENGIDDNLIENLVEGGADFTSTDKYINNVRRLL